MSYIYTNFLKELTEDEGKYLFIKKYYSVIVDSTGKITLELKEGKEMYTDIKKLIIHYSKASFDSPLGRLEYYIAYNMDMEYVEGYHQDQVISFFNNLGVIEE